MRKKLSEATPSHQTPRVTPAVAVIGLVALAGCADLRHVDPAADAAALRRLLDEGRGARADVAIILGCPAEDDGSPSLCQLCRVKSAVRAYRRGEVRAVIFSGAAVWSPAVEADVMATVARRAGLPEEAILREPRALTTWMNLRFSQRIMRARGDRRALLITTANHAPRAARFAASFGLDASYRACDLEPPLAPGELDPPN